MHKKYGLLGIIFCISLAVQAQTLSGDYTGFLYRTYYVGKYEKGNYVLIDSLKLNDKGTFSKPLNPTIYTPNTLYAVVSEGEYKKKNMASPHPHSSIRFVYMGGDVSYKTSWKQETGYLNFIKGGEASNQIKELNNKLQIVQSQLNSIEQLMGLLEEADPLLKQLMEGYIQKATVFNTYCQSIAEQYPKGSYMNVYAQMYQQVVPEKRATYAAFQTYRAKNLFQFTDLRNPLVANVPMLLAMYSSYLYHNQPSGMVASDAIQKMQDDAKAYIQKNACAQVLETLNMQEFRPQVQIMRERFINELAFDDLYKDNEAWIGKISEILGAYNASSPYHALFGKDVITALERTKTPQAYTKLAESAISITEQFNWSEAQTQVVDYLTEKADERLLKGSGKIAQIYTLKNIQIGKQAPDLVITEHIGKLEDHNHSTKVLKSSELATGDYTQTLLVFYQSGCGPCEVLMQQLPQKYEALKAKGIRVISLSADEGELVFKNSSRDYPWPDKHCDFEGKAGVNFKNYGVKGTPTLILLDKQGSIVSKSASIEEVLEINQILNK